MKKEILCAICGSKYVKSTKHIKRTGKPKNAKLPSPFAKVSYGRVYYENICECGHTWEIESHL